MTIAPAVFRAPMRSRDTTVADDGAAVERALRLGVVGMGARPADERLARRLQRFIEAPDGAVVVTRDARGRVHCGRLSGDYRRDDTAEARDVDLVHVRPCTWAADPLDDAEIPPAVRQTFARGGKNWQRVHDRDAETLLAAWWASR